jgi:hypothetical protein
MGGILFVSRSGQSSLWLNVKAPMNPAHKLTSCFSNINFNIIPTPFIPCSSLSIFIFYLSVTSFLEYRSRYSDWLRAGRLRVRSSSPGKGKIFLFSTASRPVLGLTQSTIQWVPGALSMGVKRQGREADHSLLVRRSRIRGSIHPFPSTCPWRTTYSVKNKGTLCLSQYCPVAP